MTLSNSGVCAKHRYQGYSDLDCEDCREAQRQEMLNMAQTRSSVSPR